tara:strand:- start:1610 stop:2179 length:570 start_codon:yes stop_codon:yes gene_type:complete
MALTRVTKHIIHGSLLVQFKYVENTGDFDLNSSQSTYTEVNSKNIVMTPQYADSILEDSTSMSVKQNHSTDNVHDEISVALFVNGTNEFETTELLGVQPYSSSTHSHTGGRNDRTAPTRRHSHITNIALASGYTHAFIPRSTNAIVLETRVRSTIDADFKVRDLFMIAKEIGVPDDNVSGGSGSINDGV